MKKYTEEQLMELQITDMAAYLRAISGNDEEPENKETPKKVKKHFDKFPKEFGNSYGDVDDIYLKGKKKHNKHFKDDYYEYSGSSLLDSYDEDDDDEDDSYDGIAAIYSKGNKRIKKHQKKAKREDYYYYDDFIDEFSNTDNPVISDKEVTAYKAIRARINRLEEGVLSTDEYTTLVKLCAVIAKLHTVEPEHDTTYDDYNYGYYQPDTDDEEEEDDDETIITAGSHLGNQHVKVAKDDPTGNLEEEMEDESDEEEDDEEEEEVVETSLESIFYTRYDTSFERMAINSQFVSLNVQMDANPVINLRSAAPKIQIFTSMDEVKDFIKKYFIPYMCGHMHPSIIVKRQLFETTAKTNYKYDPTKYVFISRGEYVNCYYIDPEQYNNLQNGIEYLASGYEGLSNEDIIANASLIVMDLISELYRDASSINNTEYDAICTDDNLTSKSRFEKFWSKFYHEKNALNVLPNIVPIDAMEYEEIQLAMFLFVTEWREEDGDTYKSIDEQFTDHKPSEVVVNGIDMGEDEEEDSNESSTDEIVDAIPEPVVEDVESLLTPIPVHE